MKGQNTNRILPIKSLLQNLKQQTKKQYLQLDNKLSPPQPKNHPHNHPQNNAASRITPTPTISITHRPQFPNELTINQHPKQLQKGISLNKTSEKGNSHRQFAHAVEFPHPSFFTPKKDKNSHDNPHFSILTQDSYKMDSQIEHHYNINKNNKSQHHFYQAFKPHPKNPEHRLAEDNEKESLTLTDKLNSKFEEETRHASKFQKIESQPIFKDEITKIKTELFQKEATLFQKTQQLEEKEKIISALQEKLKNKHIDSGEKQKIMSKEKDLKETIQGLSKRIHHQQEEIQKQKVAYNVLEEKYQNQDNIIEQLRTQLQERSEELRRYEDDNATNYALINLKLRQYEVQERQRAHQIIEIKEKERRTFEHQEKIIKNLNQTLKGKDEIISQMKNKIFDQEEEIRKNKTTIEEKALVYAKQIESKQYIIRELLAQEGDLKNSLKNMELRIRQMIEEEEELKKIADQRKTESDKLKIAMEGLSTTFIAEKTKLQKEIKETTMKLIQLSEDRKSKEEIHSKNMKDLQSKLFSTSQSFSKRQLSFKQKIKELEDTVKKISMANKASPPKTNTSKLIKDNERLSLIIKDIDGRLYQSLKLNHTLNQQICKRELMRLNGVFSNLQKDIE